MGQAATTLRRPSQLRWSRGMKMRRSAPGPDASGDERSLLLHLAAMPAGRNYTPAGGAERRSRRRTPNKLHHKVALPPGHL
jgi:hypothetical protein